MSSKMYLKYYFCSIAFSYLGNIFLAPTVGTTFLRIYTGNAWSSVYRFLVTLFGFDRLFALAGDKPIAISETGYPAQTLELQDAGLTFPSTPEKQHAYITGLLAQADAYDLQFIVNFVLRDYDALYDAIGGGDLAAIWRDTGFYDENGLGRPALEAWQQTLARPYMP